jgi:5'(3')-deoxyribonucleotidase
MMIAFDTVQWDEIASKLGNDSIGNVRYDVSPHLITTKKKTIACDCDEVLAYFVPALARWHNETYGTRLDASDFHSYTFKDVWGGDHDETMSKMEMFFKTPYFKNIKPVENAFETLKRLRGRFRFVVVTSRQHYLKTQTIEWINRHFPGIFEEILLGNHWTRSDDRSIKITKKEMCKKAGACVLIDDSTKYARQCALSLDHVILFGQYAWNRNVEPFKSNVHRVRNWSEVETILSRYL